MKEYTQICSIEGCDKKITRYSAKGLCPFHYNRARNSRDMHAPKYAKMNKSHSDICCMDGCDKKYYAKGYCSHHYEVFIKRPKHVKKGRPCILCLKQTTISEHGICHECMRIKKWHGKNRGEDNIRWHVEPSLLRGGFILWDKEGVI